MQESTKQLLEKWAPVLDSKSVPSIKENYRREVTAILLENQEKESAKTNHMFAEAASSPANSSGSYPDTGGMAKFDPVLISLVRRAMPQLIAYDIAGVQPMTQPTGLIFAMKSRYSTMNGTEALYNEPNSGFSGTGTQAGTNPTDSSYTTGTGMTTAAAEQLGSDSSAAFGQMAFSIEKQAVTATSRALKAEYSIELAQDMQSVHGLDAENEITNILSTEILAEINREMFRNVYTSAKAGAVVGTATAGTFDLDVDSNGRWMVEKFKGLMFQLEREANAIAQDTRRGRGNWIICSPDVASALVAAGKLDYTPALSTDLNVDVASTTFAGVLNGRYRVYVDPYIPVNATKQFAVVGYKGSSPFDAGIFYCPYVPLQVMHAIDPNTFQPKIGFKTRYAITANPFVNLDSSVTAITANTNYYFRKLTITNLM